MNAHHTANGTIVGLVAAVPDRVINNDDCPDPAAAHEAAKLTGVQTRRWVRAGQTARDLCSEAAATLLGRLGWLPPDVDVLVYVTQTPDHPMPADVFRIADELALSKRCACLQVNWSCAGYVYGLWTIMRLLQPGQRGLLLVGDATSNICHPEDRATAPLFGDAGSATAVIGGGPLQHFFLGSDGSGVEKLQQVRGGFLHMDGAAVFNYTLRTVPQLVEDVRSAGEEPRWWFLHQANAFMLQHLAKKCGLLKAFTPTNVSRFGNCSSASIPLLMADTLFDATQSPDGPGRIGLVGMGAGWAHGGAALECGGMQACELLEV